MSEEHKTEIFKAEQNVKEKSVTSGKSNGRKWGIFGGVALILTALIIGISIYNSLANRLSRQLDLGNRYLEEQNYEQAIVEFDKAISIDPMSVDAYLGKAEAYIGLDDLQSALNTLQTSFDLIGDEKLKTKLDEIQAQFDQINRPEETVRPLNETVVIGVQDEQDYIGLPFSVSGVTIMGYDLLQPHFDELIVLFEINMDDLMRYGASDVGYPHGHNVKPYGEIEANTLPNGNRNINILDDNGCVWLSYWDSNSLHLDNWMNKTGNSNRIEMETVCDLPIYAGDTYEEWCKKLKVEAIKSSLEGQFNEEYHQWSFVNESQKILTEDGWYVYLYGEGSYSSIILCSEEGLEFGIYAYFEDGIITSIQYSLNI